jgi:transcriptional regulator GlxA family with amidase domain
VKNIAEGVNLSESHLFAVFKKEIGISPITYLNNYRLSVAADELIKTDKTVVEIADIVGIGDSVYFNKIFRKSYQMSPSKYREIYKNGRE